MELLVNYFDDSGNKNSLELNPFVLSGYIPKGEKSTVNNFDTIFRLIPINKVITSLQIKVTEVNGRKKDWDKLLELFNKNKDKGQDYIIDNLINKE